MTVGGSGGGNLMYEGSYEVFDMLFVISDSSGSSFSLSLLLARYSVTISENLTFFSFCCGAERGISDEDVACDFCGCELVEG